MILCAPSKQAQYQPSARMRWVVTLPSHCQCVVHGLSRMHSVAHARSVCCTRTAFHAGTVCCARTQSVSHTHAQCVVHAHTGCRAHAWYFTHTQGVVHTHAQGVAHTHGVSRTHSVSHTHGILRTHSESCAHGVSRTHRALCTLTCYSTSHTRTTHHMHAQCVTCHARVLYTQHVT